MIQTTAHGRPIHRDDGTHRRPRHGPGPRNGQTATTNFKSQPRKRRYIYRGCMATEEVPTLATLPYTDACRRSVVHYDRALLQSMLQATIETDHSMLEDRYRASFDLHLWNVRTVRTARTGSGRAAEHCYRACSEHQCSAAITVLWTIVLMTATR